MVYSLWLVEYQMCESEISTSKLAQYIFFDHININDLYNSIVHDVYKDNSFLIFDIAHLRRHRFQVLKINIINWWIPVTAW